MSTQEASEPRCPACGSARVVPIVYGLVRRPLEETDDVELAGCVVPMDPPSHRCRDCGAGFGRFEPVGDDDDAEEDR